MISHELALWLVVVAALAAARAGDYATVMQIVRPMAAQGNAEAQLMLGLMYANAARKHSLSSAILIYVSNGLDHRKRFAIV